jgi:hypothetical protein
MASLAISPSACSAWGAENIAAVRACGRKETRTLRLLGIALA